MEREKLSLDTRTLSEFFERAISEKEDSNSNIKYVIYVRKSTDESDKQIRSIEDQITECIDYAKKNNLKYVEVLEERCSAKESGKRPVFLKMLKEIKNNKYGGVISWHPDRLSRNMKEAGEVIDMVDKNIIKELKFVSFVFNNDPSGKLLLGITFAMSKEYSDKLSQNVKRGNRNILREGKYPNKAKNGYYKDSEGYMRPDGANYDLIKQAFVFRESGATLEHIAEYLNQNASLVVSDSISKIKLPKFRKQEVSEIISDPIYAGVMVYGKNVYDFTSVYDFVPMITPQQFVRLNESMKRGYVTKVIREIRKNNVKADLLRGCIICNECQNSMVSGITKNSRTGINYFYYRCDTKGCPLKGGSLRANIIIKHAVGYIENNFVYTEEVWDHYRKEMQRVYKESVKNLEEESARLYNRRNEIKKKQESLKESLLQIDANSALSKSYQKDFDMLVEEFDDIERKIIVNTSLKTKKVTILEKNDFIEQMKKLPIFIRKTSEMRLLDQTLRKVFLNFYVDRKNVVKTTLNSPFNILFETKVSSGAGERT